ncbi:ABC transporter family substrate-binding protein [Paeniglutamicibacter psychrophenolicus]|uniref:ABC transporter family substrate-binding protein n=1 Tax=Paeniglutamicibacter psychrophenolicus TaxID=257454 RepID=UPI00278409AD|nr:ABC transporter family substrate-binding protein [Paeniglutamicibacter psychrophenolicus]MDQ0094797.1 peptide/nickel transport system substrate-binding protein [Paeniglutamicibacter psychrophenolicus]
MRVQRISKAVAVGAALALALTACAPGGGNAPSESATTSASGSGTNTVEPANSGRADLGEVTTKDDEIKVTVGAPEFIGYNSYTPQTYSTYNSAITERVLSGFSYFGTDGKIYANDDMVTYEKVSDDPLTIKYTINPDAKWSDGTQITTADAVLAWSFQNANLKNAKGKQLFDSVSADLGDTVPKGPEGAADSKEFTVTFKNPDPDWQIQTWIDTPAHIVAKQGGMSTAEFVDAARAGDAEALTKAAEFWNTGWTTKPGTLPDAELIPSSGPYKLKSWAAGQSVTLEANENYYGTPPATKTLTFRFVDDGAMVQALQNKDLDVINPQPTVDTLAQLKALGDAVNIQQGDTMTWEHLDFNFRDKAAFKDSLELRQAFAMCVPRQEIVDNLIVPLNPEAKVLNAREVFPFQDSYDEVVGASYDGRYDAVDIAGAKKILEEQDAVGTKVRIGYSAPNPRRTDEVAMIKSSCDQAGFEVVDAGDPKFFAPGGTQERGDYDVALFAWAGSGQITSGQNIYASGKPQNYGQYSNKDVDAAWERLATSMDPAVHLTETKNIEKLLWDDLFGIPVFAHPGLSASSADIKNVRHTATQSQIVWNAEQWVRAE